MSELAAVWGWGFCGRGDAIAGVAAAAFAAEVATRCARERGVREGFDFQMCRDLGVRCSGTGTAVGLDSVSDRLPAGTRDCSHSVNTNGHILLHTCMKKTIQDIGALLATRANIYTVRDR